MVQHSTIDHTGITGVSTFREVAAYRTATQTIADVTWTSVEFTAADLVDADSVHDPSSNSSRLTIPASWNGRRVVFGAGIEWAGDTTGRRGVRIVKNAGLTRVGEIFGNTSSSAGLPLRQQYTTRPLTVATADYFQCQVWQDSGAGGGLNIQSTAESTLIFFAYTVD